MGTANKVEDNKKSAFRSGKRDRLEIVSAIIAIAQQPSTVTRMMGYANLNYSLLKEYLTFMMGKHLIEKQDIARGTKKTVQVYQTTEKGNRFLELYCESLILLHGEAFLQNNTDLAEAYLLQYCRRNKLNFGLKLYESLKPKVKKQEESVTSDSPKCADKG